MADIAEIMRLLDISEEEAKQLIADDKAIDKGADLFPLTAEQKKAEKKARGTGTKTVYTFTKRERKENTTKSAVIAQLYEFLASLDSVENLTVTNKEREITFSIDEKNFQLNLIQKREKKG